MIIQVLGLTVPEVTTLEIERMTKALRELAIELAVEEVYRLVSNYASIARDYTFPALRVRVPRTLVGDYELEIRTLTIGQLSLRTLLPENRIEQVETIREILRGLYEINNVRVDYLTAHTITSTEVQFIATVYKSEDWQINVDEVSVKLRKLRESEGWVLRGEGLYILKLEEVKIPKDVLPFDASFRSSYHRAGALWAVSNFDIGYHGRPEVVLYLPPRRILTLEHRARAVQVRFMKLVSEVEGYSGQWQGK